MKWQKSSRQDDKLYKEWVKAVKDRDDWTCQYPNCGCNKKVQAHHISRYADNLYGRYDIKNGITLCITHHKMVTGKEEAYAPLFFKILANKHTK